MSRGETPERIARWEAFGGTWEVAEATTGDGGAAPAATVLLRRCDGGEVAETVTSSDPGFVRWAARAAREAGRSGRA